MQKFFFISSDILADNILRGIVEVLEEIIDSGFLTAWIFEYISCFISILSTTASTTQSAFLTSSKSSSILPVVINWDFSLSTSNGGLDLMIRSFAFSVI